jgi:hypothetical protein
VLTENAAQVQTQGKGLTDKFHSLVEVFKWVRSA